MRIVLADYWNAATLRLSKSLQQASVDYQLVVIHPEGHLHESIWNAFRYYTGWHNKKGKGLRFNEVKVPALYEIRHENAFSAHIYSGDFLAGTIHYFSGGERRVRQVDWLNRKGQIIVSDLYTIQGHYVAYQVYNRNEKPIRKLFLNAKQEEIIDWDLTNNQLILKYDGARRHFANMTNFIVFFLKEMVTKQASFSKVEGLFINSLSYPLFVANQWKELPTTLFFQETIQANEIPGNMCAQLENQTAIERIVFETTKELSLVQQKYGQKTEVELVYLSPLERFKHKPLYAHRALILTVSDELIDIEIIMASLPTLSLTIAAPTEMSNKLYALQAQYPSITLRPQVNNETIKKLIETHDIYLDIHAGDEVANIVFRMYEQNNLIIGIPEAAKNARYELIVKDTKEICLMLSSIREDRKQEDRYRKQLHEKNGPTTTIKQYKRNLRL
ncbi:hypothetical protein ONC83_002946 [Listeria monocytogenes]|nr:hypothetical protein [Listeria monocytogenes]